MLQTGDKLPSASATEGQPSAARPTLDWVLTFFAIVCLLLIPQLGGVGALLFLLPAGFIILSRLRDSFEALLGNAPLFLLPALCFVSALWSDYPALSARSAVQFLLTIIIGIVLAECMRPRVFVSSLFCALFVIAIASLLFGVNAYSEMEERFVHQGIFESKNQMAELGVYLSLSSLGVVLDRLQPRLLRRTGLAALITGIYCIQVAHSAGSTVFVVPAILSMLSLAGLSRLPGQTRAGLFIAGALAMLSVSFAAAIILQDSSVALAALGKDATLTGRTELWSNAQLYIMERPLLGVGYQAFWQPDNPRAIELWIENHVPIGSGFNFHNLYFNTGVELGAVGLAVLCVLLLSTLWRLFVTLLGPIKPRHLIATGFLVYLVFISPFEVIQTYQFGIGTVLFYVSWCYLKPQWKTEPRPKPLSYV